VELACVCSENAIGYAFIRSILIMRYNEYRWKCGKRCWSLAVRSQPLAPSHCQLWVCNSRKHRDLRWHARLEPASIRVFASVHGVHSAVSVVSKPCCNSSRPPLSKKNMSVTTLSAMAYARIIQCSQCCNLYLKSSPQGAAKVTVTHSGNCSCSNVLWRAQEIRFVCISNYTTFKP